MSSLRCFVALHTAALAETREPLLGGQNLPELPSLPTWSRPFASERSASPRFDTVCSFSLNVLADHAADAVDE